MPDEVEPVRNIGKVQKYFESYDKQLESYFAANPRHQ